MSITITFRTAEAGYHWDNHWYEGFRDFTITARTVRACWDAVRKLTSAPLVKVGQSCPYYRVGDAVVILALSGPMATTGIITGTHFDDAGEPIHTVARDADGNGHLCRNFELRHI